jgi:hypothetical protein
MTALIDDFELAQVADDKIRLSASEANAGRVWATMESAQFFGYAVAWIETTSTGPTRQDAAEKERRTARERMRRMRERARAKTSSSPDYPDTEQDQADQMAVTTALQEWQNEAIWNS